MDTRRIAVALVALLLFTTAAWAASTAVPVQNDIPVTTDQTPTAILETGDGSDLDLTSYFEGDQLDITTPQGNITVSGDSGAEFRIALENIEGTKTEVTGISAGSDWIELNPDDKQRVVIRGDADALSFESVAIDDGSTDLQIVGTTGGSAEVRIYGLSANTTHALYEPSRDETMAVAETDANGVLQTTVSLPDGSQSFEVRTADGYADAAVTNLQPTGQITERPTELTLDATVGAAPANITWTLDGETINTTTISSNGTYSVPAPEVNLGEHNWSATITDEVGQTDTSSTTFQTPVELEIREEHAPTELVTNANLTLRFFTVGGDVAIERDVTNGTLNMEGLPDSEFVVFGESGDHYARTAFLPSIYEQNTIYLLNETAVPRDANEAVRSRFLYEDPTGDFPVADTTVQIQRAIDPNGDGTSEFVTIAGDFWGASGEYEAILERGVRYRLKLVNRETGDSTIVGTHIPTEELTQRIQVTGLVQKAKNGSGVTALAEYGDGGTIDLAYSDPADRTESLDVTVEPQTGGDPIFEETVDGPIGDYGTTIQLNESQTDQDYIVQYDAGDRHRSTLPVGSGTVTLPVMVPGWLMSILMTIAVTFVGALYGPRTAVLGSWSMVFVSAGVSMFGWAFGAPSVLAAALIATAFTFVERVRP